METDGGDRMARAYGPPSQGKLPLSLASLSRASLLPPKASWLSRLSLARKASSEASCMYLLPLQLHLLTATSILLRAHVI